jgi:hypothetical protein
MINELIERLKNAIRDGIRAKIKTIAEAFFPGVAVSVDEKVILVASEGNIMDMGKRYRLTSGHSPLFSLFTFFGLR